MNNPTNKEDLAYLGMEFQYAAVKQIIEDPTLLPDIYAILDQNCFTNSYLRSIVGLIKDKFKSLSTVPNYKELKVFLADKATNEDDMQFYGETLEKIKGSTDIQPGIVKSQLTDFFKWKYMLGMLREGAEKLKSGWDAKVYNKTLKNLETLQKFGADTAEVGRYESDAIYPVFTEGDEDLVPTFLKDIDERLGGGVSRGDIALLNAPTGAGKTTFSTILAHNAAVAGYNVLQIYFEDRQTDILRKHLAIETKVSIGQLKRMSYAKAKAAVKKIMGYPTFEALNAHLIICRMEDRNTTVEDITAKMDELSNTIGFRPDLVIIDYFSCLKHSSNPTKDPYAAQAGCMRKIKEKIAMRYKTAVWVMQQTNRVGSANGSAAGKENWQGSIEATQPASVWVEIRRTREQAQEGTCDIIFHKSRLSKMYSDLEDVKFDNGLLTIDTSGCHEIEKVLEYNEDDDEYGQGD